MCRRSDLSTISEQLQMMSASNANWCKCWSWFYAQLNQDALSQTHANTNVNTNANTSTNTNAGHDSVLKMPGPRVISYCCASPRRPVPLTLPSVRDGKRPVGGFPSEPLTITMHQPRPRCLKIQEGAASDGGLIRTRESRNACVPPTTHPPMHACACTCNCEMRSTSPTRFDSCKQCSLLWQYLWKTNRVSFIVIVIFPACMFIMSYRRNWKIWLMG